MSRIDLRVPIAEKGEAKRLGARWDPQGKTWYVPDGADATPLQKWVPAPQSPNIRAKSWYLASATRDCWRCDEISQVFGIVLPQEHEVLIAADDPKDDCWQAGYLPTILSYVNDVSESVRSYLRTRAPRYRLDYSQTTQSSYWMNHCEHCGIKLGDFETFDEPGLGFRVSENIRLVEIPEPFTGWCGSHTEGDEELLAVVRRSEETSNGIKPRSEQAMTMT